MAEDGGVGGRPVVGDKGRYSAGCGGFTATCERLSALCVRSVGRSLAQESGSGDVIVVRYADDLVVGFDSRADAERFLEEFRKRLAKFGHDNPPHISILARVQLSFRWERDWHMPRCSAKPVTVSTVIARG